MQKTTMFLGLIVLCLGFCQTVLAAPVPDEKPAAPTGFEESGAAAEHQTPPAWISRPYALDRPLTRRERQLYNEVILLQKRADWDKADLLLDKIDNTVLFGHIHAMRILSPSYRSAPSELVLWLGRYHDHPQAAAIARVLDRHNADPGTDHKATAPSYKHRLHGTMEELRYFAKGSKYFSENYKSGERYELNLVRREIQKYLDRGAATAALSFFDKHRVNAYIDPIDKSQLLADIAAVYLYLGHKSKARKTAARALESSSEAPIAGWVAGLIAWLDKDYKTSAKYFTMASEAEYASPWMTSAAAYWAARASTRAGLYRDVSALLATAVKNQRTFYGLIATKALGYGYDFNWTMPEFTPKMKNALLRYPAGARAVALAETGQATMAQAELFTLPVLDKPELRESAIAFANHYNLAGFAMRFSSALNNPAGGYYDAGLYPVSSWVKSSKEKVDEELLNAFIRQESRFDTMALNATGATGLMQVMPATAAYIMQDDRYKSDARTLLRDPRCNVDVGTKYLDHLLGLDVVDNDLFGLTIAYNAGPGKLSRWKQDLKIDDPLLFIELIPASETRAFVERVMTNYWIYQMRAGKNPVTLEAVASGVWPHLNR